MNILILNPPISIKRLSLKLNLKFFLILNSILIIIFLISYIFQVNALISESYQIQNYQKKIEKLTSENKILEINSFKMNSLENIENKIQNLGFQKTDKIYYIQILEGQMVSK